ncbi:transcriptional regulator opi1 [Coemansia furcata]|uniref:Transcriptional regulator opi1 n=1 Tax=Coemansia furcata TaxID=417177 RepID=A0ACC1LML7_9FUNG|nr:transcriptional regulator opi1 [Coemansia furcata]
MSSDSAGSINSAANDTEIVRESLGARESTSSARVSIAGLVNDDDDHAEAAEALGILRGGGSMDEDSRWMKRVQAIPLVNSALGMYGRSKQSSALLRAGTNVIESGVRKMCQPIAKRIDTAQLDSFACRQLDNLGYAEEEGPNLRKRTMDQTQEDTYDNGKGKDVADTGRWRVGSLVASARDRAVAYREDSVRRLRYCLEWVAYATALLRQHIDDLRRLLASLQEAAQRAFARNNSRNPSHQPLITDTLEPQDGDANERLQRARREIVGAVRKAVAVVSNYAGSVLPGEARRQVRDLILNLPGRWASVHSARSSGAGSGSPSVASDAGAPSDGAAHIDANVRRTLAFANESFTMLNGVRAVFQNLYTNAERWMGAPPAQQIPSDGGMGAEEPMAYREPPEASSSAWQRQHAARHRRPLPLGSSEPMMGGGGGGSSQSLGDIGERMRLMGVDAVEDDAMSYKRNRTREPTPL